MNKLRQALLSLAVFLVIGSWTALTPGRSSSAAVPTTTYVPSSTPYPTATYSPTLATAIANRECLNSFDSFAYHGPRDRSEEKTPPLSPWQMVATITPLPGRPYFSYPNYSVLLSRVVGGHQEIWLRGGLIFKPETREWETISLGIGNTGLYVGTLFAAPDQSIWGMTLWDAERKYPDRESVPVLSRFNENTRRFELAEGVVEIPLVLDSNYFNWTRIVLDRQGIFWIFTENDGIYRYDPVARTTEKRANLPGFQVTYTALSLDGNLYFMKYNSGPYTAETFLRAAEQGTLFEFISKPFGEVVPVNFPGDWPFFSGMVVDHDGRLWLGSIGYRDLDGIWILAYPHPESFFDVVDSGAYSEVWAPAYLMFESSDGILWYRKFLDDGPWDEGTAWYDPSTGEGCLFTNLPANIVEDSNHQLWLVADGILYKYALNS